MCLANHLNLIIKFVIWIGNIISLDEIIKVAPFQQLSEATFTAQMCQYVSFNVLQMFKVELISSLCFV